ncbi:GA module-containing protein, partial [Mycoplasmopsis gallopavonis]
MKKRNKLIFGIMGLIPISILQMSVLNVQGNTREGDTIYNQFNNYIIDNKWSSANYLSFTEEWNQGSKSGWSNNPQNGAYLVSTTTPFRNIDSRSYDQRTNVEWWNEAASNGNWWSGDGFDKNKGIKRFRIAFHKSQYNVNESNYSGGIFLSNDMVLTGTLRFIFFDLDVNNTALISPKHSQTITLTIDETANPEDRWTLNPYMDKSNYLASNPKKIEETQIPLSHFEYKQAYNLDETGRGNLATAIIHGTPQKDNSNLGLKKLTNVFSEVKNNLGFYLSFHVDAPNGKNNGAIIEFDVKPNDRTKGSGQGPMEKAGKSFVGAGVSIEHYWLSTRYWGNVGFYTSANRKQTYIKKFTTKENIANNTYTNGEKLPQTTLTIEKDHQQIWEIDKRLQTGNESSFNTKNIVNDDVQITEDEKPRTVLRIAFKNPEDPKKWKIASNIPHIESESSLDGFWEFTPVVYDLTDRYKLTKEIQKHTNLTKSQRDFLLTTYLDSILGSEKTDFTENAEAELQKAIDYISLTANRQSIIEQRYKKWNDYKTNEDKDSTDFTNKEDYLFSSIEDKNKFDESLSELGKYGNIKSESNPTGHNKENTNEIPLIYLSSGLPSGITMPTNSVSFESFTPKFLNLSSKLSGRTFLKEQKDKLNNIDIISAHSNNLEKTQALFMEKVHEMSSKNPPSQNDANANAITDFVGNVQDLSNKFNSLKKINEIAGQINSTNPIYSYSDQAYKTQFVTNKGNSSSIVQGVSNGTSTIFDNFINFNAALDTTGNNPNGLANIQKNLKTALENLNGNKTEAIKEINGFKNLNQPENSALITKINALPANFVFDNSENLTNNSTSNNQKINEIMSEAWTTASTNFKNQIENTANLTTKQKDHFKSLVNDDKKYTTNLLYFDDRNLAFTNTPFSNISSLAEKTKALKDYYDNLEDSFKNLTDEKYVYADDAKKNEYQKRLFQVKEALGLPLTEEEKKNSNYEAFPEDSYYDPAKIEELKTQFDTAKNTLDGINFDKVIDGLANLSDDLKNQIKKEKESLNGNHQAINDLREKAVKLDEKVGKLINSLKDAINNKQQDSYTDYSNASNETKTPFDNKVTEIKNMFETNSDGSLNWKLKGVDPQPTSFTNLVKNVTDNVETKKTELKNTIDQLDGEEIKAEQTRINAISAKYDYSNQKNRTLPSEASSDANKTHFTYTTNPSPLKDATVEIVSFKDVNDDQGTLTVVYKVKSTKFPNISTVIEKQGDSAVNGFLTKAEREFDLKKAEVQNNINQKFNEEKITEEQKNALLDELNKITYPAKTKEDLVKVDDKLNNLVAANDAIDKLKNITTKQKEQLKSEIATNNDVEVVKQIVKDAQSLDNSIGELEKELANAKTKQKDSIYTQDTAEHKKAVDDAINDARTKLAEILNDTLTKDNLATNKDKIDKEATDTSKGSLQKLKDALDNLDGNREDLRNKIKNFKYLKENDLMSLNYQINQLPKENITNEKIKEILSNALTRSKENVKLEVGKLDLLTQNEKNSFYQAITDATLNAKENGIDPKEDQNGTIEKYDKNLDAILQSANDAQMTKRKAIAKIYGDEELKIPASLLNLNTNQKMYLKELIKSNPVSQTQIKSQEAQDINDAMGIYKDLFVNSDNEKPTNISPLTKADYLDSSKAVKDLFDNQLAQRDQVVALDGPLKTLDDLVVYKKNDQGQIETDAQGNKVIDLSQGLIGNLLQARKNLDGDERIALRKQEIKDKTITDPNTGQKQFSSLTDDQIQLIQDKLAGDELDRLSKVNDFDAHVTKLNDEMEKILKYIEAKNGNEAKNIKPFTTDLMYAGSNAAKRKAYDDALKKAEEFINKLNQNPKPNDLDLLSYAELEKINEEISNAINALDGKENMDRLQKAEIANINNYSNLNDAQKEMLISKVLLTRMPEEIEGTKASDGVTITKDGIRQIGEKLNTSMGELNKLTQDEKGENPNTQNTRETTDYIDSDNETFETVNDQGVKEQSKVGRRDNYDLYIQEANNLYQPHDLIDPATGEAQRVNTREKSGEIDSKVIDKFVSKLKEAREALNGNERFQQAKDRLEKALNNKGDASLPNGLNYENLNQAQRDYFKEEVNKAKTIADLDKIEIKATALDDSMKRMKQAIHDAENEHTITVVNPDGTTSTVTQPGVEQTPKYTEASPKTKNPYDQTKQTMKDLLDNLPNKETVTKEDGTEEVVDKDLVLDPAKVDSLVTQFLEDKANLDGDGAFALEKERWIEIVKNDPNLNLAQKHNLINEIEKTKTKTELQKITDQIDPLSQAMKNLREIQNEANNVLDKPIYKNSSQDRKDALNSEVPNNLGAIQNNNKLIDDVATHFIPEYDVKNTSINANLDEVNALITKTREAIDNLNGDQELQKAKDKAIELINGNNLSEGTTDLDSYNKLNDAQKEYLINKIKEATLIDNDNGQSVNEILKEAKDLNDQMKNLDEYLTNVVREGQNVDPKTKNNYKDASQNLKDNFDHSYSDSNQVLDKTQGANLDKTQVEQLLKNVKKDYESLDGDKRRKDALDKLQKLVDNDPSFKETDIYKDGEADKKEIYDTAIDNGNLVLENKDQKSIDEILDGIKQIEKAIDSLKDNKQKLIDIIKNLPNLSDQEKDKYIKEIEDSTSYEQRQEIINRAIDNNDAKQKLIDYINSLPNLDPKDKEALINRVINADGENKAELEKIKQDATDADLLVEKLLNDAKTNHKLTNQELEEILNKLAETGINNPNYSHLVDEMKQFNDLRDALKAYRDDQVDSNTYLNNKTKLEELINKDYPYTYNQDNVSDAWNHLVDDLLKLKQEAKRELNLVEELLINDKESFNNQIRQGDIYHEIAQELDKINYFELINKKPEELTRKELATLRELEQKDASNVIYSAIKKQIANHRPFETLSWP